MLTTFDLPTGWNHHYQELVGRWRSTALVHTTNDCHCGRSVDTMVHDPPVTTTNNNKLDTDRAHPRRPNPASTPSRRKPKTNCASSA